MNITSQQSGLHGSLVAVLEAVRHRNGPRGRLLSECALGGYPGVGAISRPGTEMRQVNGTAE